MLYPGKNSSGFSSLKSIERTKGDKASVVCLSVPPFITENLSPQTSIVLGSWISAVLSPRAARQSNRLSILFKGVNETRYHYH